MAVQTPTQFKLTVTEKPPARRQGLTDVLVTVVLPAVILMQASDPERLGPVWALIAALSLPLFWGLRDLVSAGRWNGLAILGIVSVLLTGGVGLLTLDAQWLAVKEAAIPGAIGIAVLISTKTRWPLVRTMVMRPEIVDVPRINAELGQRGNTPVFDRMLSRANVALAGTFFFSAAMNYGLARWLVTSPGGTPEFNEELGRLTLLSYPMIALPSMVMMAIILYWLVRSIRALTGLKLSELLAEEHAKTFDE